MRYVRTALFAGVGALAFAGSVAAQTLPTHVMTVPLPGGGMEQIRYSGDVAPQVMLRPGPAPLSAAFSGDPSFAAFEQIAAEMDREAMALLNATALFDRPGVAPERLLEAAARSGAGVCMRSVEITQRPGEQPQVVRRTAGNCGDAAGPATPASRSLAAPPRQQPRTLSVKAEHVRPPRGAVQQVAWAR